MKKMFSKMLIALKKATPMYLALLVICGVLANAGVALPSALQWAYEPVEQTTAYAASVIEEFEQAQAPQQASPPVRAPPQQPAPLPVPPVRPRAQARALRQVRFRSS